MHILEKSGSWDILKTALSQSDCTIFQFLIFHEPLKYMGPYFAWWKNSIRRRHRYIYQCHMFAQTCPGMPILGQIGTFQYSCRTMCMFFILNLFSKQCATYFSHNCMRSKICIWRYLEHDSQSIRLHCLPNLNILWTS